MRILDCPYLSRNIPHGLWISVEEGHTEKLGGERENGRTEKKVVFQMRSEEIWQSGGDRHLPKHPSRPCSDAADRLRSGRCIECGDGIDKRTAGSKIFCTNQHGLPAELREANHPDLAVDSAVLLGEKNRHPSPAVMLSIPMVEYTASSMKPRSVAEAWLDAMLPPCF